jgi:type IV pilus assembly protein PilC
MPSFYYRARDPEGRPHEGVEVASSEEDVLRMLEEAKLVPVLIEARDREAPAGSSAEALGTLVQGFGRTWKGGVRPGSVALFARQLATMVSAGLPLVRSLRSIARDHEDRRLAAILERVADDVQKGDTLAAALAKHPHAFGEVFVSLVNTGEVSGTLDQILEQTATYMERSEDLRLKVEAALRYPTFVLVFSMLVMLGMLLWVIPRFSDIYSRFKVPLPWPTLVLLNVSHAITDNALLALLIAGAAVLAGWNAARTEAGRLWIDRAKFRMPIFGSLIRMYAVTKTARTLGMLTGSGTQILHALRVLRPVPGNKVLELGLEQVRSRVEQGSSLARAMSETGVFPEMLVQMTATGEETGQLDGMLKRTADFYEQRVSSAVQGLSSLIEPIAIVILGAIVGIMLIALYLPIFSLGQAMRQGLLGH